MFNGAFIVGLKFLVHPCIIRLLAELEVHPCRLYPNSWGFIIYFMVRCHQLGIPLNTFLFKSIFMIKNSPLSKDGWVQSNIELVLGTLWTHTPFQTPIMAGTKSSSFLNEKVEIGKSCLKLTSVVPLIARTIFSTLTPEMYARDELIKNNGQDHCWHFVNERKLIEAGLSGFIRGYFFLPLQLWTSLFLLHYFPCFISADDALDAVSDKREMPTRRMIKMDE